MISSLIDLSKTYHGKENTSTKLDTMDLCVCDETSLKEYKFSNSGRESVYVLQQFL